ncbi:hypothetical protein [Actinacidiphila oryziradicis]|uniref:hypothetical protein n=1 Tax=Actinacidiphila oryziradicis TaxID=2571141 RepID=UPI0023F31096|nr:hypothetical protein [Actinacidiphila oryziradicis]MCW2875088.1 hypothetical protein [Actinacidiphila oryziradicis]
MSAMFLVLLTAAGAAGAVGSVALLSAHGLRRELAALRADLAAARAAIAVPMARTAPDTTDIRAAVADALADERERELSEARAFWAAQEAREGADTPLLGATGPVPGAEHSDYEVLPFGPYLPRQADLAGLDSGGLPAPAHPSSPDFGFPSPVVANQEQTAERLAELADDGVPLADVRPGPLGTLDVYVFADGTTLCMTPGHRETALQLSDALDRGEIPVLLGGSAIAGAYALTFTYGEESVYILADRVVASL